MTRPTNEPPAPVTLTARSPEDVLAAVPVVLGFEPRESVVMLTFGGRETFHARVDLPGTDPHDPYGPEEAVRLLLEPAVRHRVPRVLFVVYAADGFRTREVVGRLRDAFAAVDVDVAEVLRVHEGRWFALGRPSAPPAGVPFDVGDHRFRAQAVVEGIVVHRSRRCCAPSPGR